MMELYIGSHLSTAGGWNALLERSHEEGGTAFAFFPRSPYGKRSKALDPAGAAAFGARLKAEGYGPLVVHAPYVYNLAGKDEAKRTFAIEALAEDIELLTAIREAGREVYINIHPGAHVGQGAETGCRLIGEAESGVRAADRRQRCFWRPWPAKARNAAVISMARHDHGWRGAIRRTSASRSTPAVCWMPAHDLVNDYDGVMRQLDEVIGLAESRRFM